MFRRDNAPLSFASCLQALKRGIKTDPSHPCLPPCVFPLRHPCLEKRFLLTNEHLPLGLYKKGEGCPSTASWCFLASLDQGRHRSMKWEVPNCPGDGLANLHWLQIGAQLLERSPVPGHTGFFPMTPEVSFVSYFPLPYCNCPCLQVVSVLIYVPLPLSLHLFMVLCPWELQAWLSWYRDRLCLSAGSAKGSRSWVGTTSCDVWAQASCFLIYKNKSNFP